MAPSEVTSLHGAQILAEDRWRIEVNRWTATPGWYLSLDRDWNRAFLVGNIEPKFADRDAFEGALVLTP